MSSQTMKPQLPANIDLLQNEIVSLHNAIKVLTSRLDPVLGPEGPMPAENCMADKASPPTRMSEQLADLTERVIEARSEIGRLTERLEI